MKNKYMNIAFDEALKAYNLDEIPVGAVIVKNDEVIAVGHNMKENKKSAIYHAEIIALLAASEKLNNWRLDECDMYVTLEPCPMCASAIKQSRIKNVYCGLSNSDKNNTLILEQIFSVDKVNPKINFYNDLDANNVRNLMQKFFSEKRKK